MTPPPPPPSCPFRSTNIPSQWNLAATANDLWWPKRLNLSALNDNHRRADDVERRARYHSNFVQLNLENVRNDLIQLLTTCNPLWPADNGHYGPFMVRLAWHSAGTYRVHDGRGGASHGHIRLAPLNSWPDNGNLDKARRLLWPIKQKYGQALSWADLYILAGTVALQHMGLPIVGFAGGRIDDYTPPHHVYWGPERKMLDASGQRRQQSSHIDKPLGAVQMGLIYVNPEGPDGHPDPMQAAHDIRDTFNAMGMNDYETVALIAGGHTFGKCHGAANPEHFVGADPEAAPLQAQGLGYINTYKTGKGPHTITSGLEGQWTEHPSQWDHAFLQNLFQREWTLTKGPGGKYQWEAPNTDTILLTTDLALKVDPHYGKIAQHFYQHPNEFTQAFAHAWYKLTHRDMGPATRGWGPWIPPQPYIWQDPIPISPHDWISPRREQQLKQQLLQRLSIPQLIRTAWASASTYRQTDHRGGANGARIRFEPQVHWTINRPEELQDILNTLQDICPYSAVSMADLIVLGGCAALEQALAKANLHHIAVPFTPGRMDALASQTDVDSFAVLEPKADGFRNYKDPTVERSSEELLLDKAHLLGLTPSQMVVLVAGMRVLGANAANDDLGVLTKRPGVLTNDFLVHLLDLNTVWEASNEDEFVGRHRTTGVSLWRASRVDLLLGSHSELRAIAEDYACADAQETFARDFVAAWTHVMNADRFDLENQRMAGRSKL